MVFLGGYFNGDVLVPIFLENWNFNFGKPCNPGAGKPDQCHEGDADRRGGPIRGGQGGAPQHQDAAQPI